MPAEMIDYGARALKPVDITSQLSEALDNLDNPHVVEAWKAMNTWSPIMSRSGRRFRQLIVELYGTTG